jgi:hypothetical protein
MTNSQKARNPKIKFVAVRKGSGKPSPCPETKTSRAKNTVDKRKKKQDGDTGKDAHRARARGLAALDTASET